MMHFMNPDDFRKIIREEVSEVIQEIVPKMIDERVGKIIDEKVPTMIEEQVSHIIDEKVPLMINGAISHQTGIITEEFARQIGLLSDKIDLNQEKNDRNFAEMREDIDQIRMNTDSQGIDILNIQKGKPAQSWRRS